MSAEEGAGNGNGPSSSAPVAFGFSKTKAQKKLAVALEEKPTERRQLITGYQAGKAQTAGPEEPDENGKKVYIVPKLENTYKTGVGKKFTPSFRPPEHDVPTAGAGEDRFEMARNDSRPAVTGYGLETRARTGEAVPQGNGAPEQPRLTLEQLERQAYKKDMETLPDAPKTEAYEDMPVEEFGKALLMGLGWKEGQGVGRNRKTIAPIEYLRRPERLGLGAAPAAPAPAAGKPRVVKMGDKPSVRPDELVLAPSADGRTRNIRTLDEKLVHRSELEMGPRPGKSMRVVGGRHAGLACVVLELLPVEKGRSVRASVRLLPSHEVVEVRSKDLQEPGQAAQQQHGDENANRASVGRDSDRGQGDRGRGRDHRDWREDTRGQRQDDEAKHDKDKWQGKDEVKKRASGRDDGGRGRDGDKGRDRDRKERDEGRDRGREKVQDRDGGSRGEDTRGWKRSRSTHDDASDDDDEGVPRGAVWLAPYIKVRVIDKKVREGRLYLKKGTIVDVHPGGTCDISMDDIRESVTLCQHQLETVVPKEMGAAVLVVAGPMRGSKARLHAKSSGGAIAVQLVHDFTVQRLLLDQVAMYVGNLDDE